MREFKIQIKHRPPIRKSGEPLFAIPKSMYNENHEMALGAKLVSDFPLFGKCYECLLPDYFYEMPRVSGVMTSLFVPTRDILSGVSFPGDIDLLIIPYENDELILSKAIAVELKIVRAKFHNQGKSPHDFGFSQAKGLLELGFPYASVIHLIVSDVSPIEHHRNMLAVEVINADTGVVELMGDTPVDMMPSDLMDRSLGRLLANCSDQNLGLLASYIGTSGIWLPRGRSAKLNPKYKHNFMQIIADYYCSNVEKFVNISRYPVW